LILDEKLWKYFETRYDCVEIKRKAFRNEDDNFKKVEVVLKIVTFYLYKPYIIPFLDQFYDA